VKQLRIAVSNGGHREWWRRLPGLRHLFVNHQDIDGGNSPDGGAPPDGEAPRTVGLPPTRATVRSLDHQGSVFCASRLHYHLDESNGTFVNVAPSPRKRPTAHHPATSPHGEGAIYEPPAGPHHFTGPPLQETAVITSIGQYDGFLTSATATLLRRDLVRPRFVAVEHFPDQTIFAKEYDTGSSDTAMGYGLVLTIKRRLRRPYRSLLPLARRVRHSIILHVSLSFRTRQPHRGDFERQRHRSYINGGGPGQQAQITAGTSTTITTEDPSYWGGIRAATASGKCALLRELDEFALYSQPLTKKRSWRIFQQAPHADARLAAADAGAFATAPTFGHMQRRRPPSRYRNLPPTWPQHGGHMPRGRGTACCEGDAGAASCP